ncbi:uncharacterized protein PHACADRAFT_126443 [Phanerochaete carnosa HHB-10118-sp]|uniref:Uncharacterized protein n=1 Tax=Phanerochaete carnosa (strain HHB-10118-sp) TaxID=650164 RepID=K5W0Y8_PHACS|nr:uncharacterized protein PHACADRAFT_126443 [Phanerochaete carnosa HHB-10118-sp]EKM52549.1 hypothetical protein PHACADRAFT_126443 [Phanerochaete carnosa HHB-10118-sp]
MHGDVDCAVLKKPQHESRGSIKRRRLVNGAAVLAVIQGLQARSLVARDDDFNWANLTASTNLSWTSCYDTFQCARLTVPLQYSNISAGEAQVALLVSPSNFSKDDPSYLGPILFNPGGPGGSGVQFVQELAPYFRPIIGPQYDLVGFDPRGAGETTPTLSVFNSPAEALEFYAPYPQNVNESVSSFGRSLAEAQILGKLAVDRVQQIAESVSTAAVATDMLNIARAFGFDKVNYWGVSYGTVIGATFAAMFPQNVGHFVIDGVVNSHEWYSGNDTSSIMDTDKALTSIYEACVEAGPSLCAIWENSTDLVRARVDKLINNVHLDPVPLINDTDPAAITFGVVDYSTLVQQLFQLVYYPFSHASTTTEALAQLEQGNGTLIFQNSDTQIVDSLASCEADSDTGRSFVSSLLDVSSAIECGDILGSSSRTFQQAREDYQILLDLSPLFAPTWYPLGSGLCTGWPLRGKDVFNGSFTTNTSNPLLFISNTLDPVTPITSGRNMSSGFAGSVLLQQNSTGHTSLSGFSTCTAIVIKEYFNNGTLPAPGTICQPDFQIFAPANETTSALRRTTEPDAANSFYEAIRVLATSDFLARANKLGRRRLHL